uniref:SH3 domain-containing protein n=1 Tax=Glossina palpalis gambiensis TaxID=67801 RepID=A0A1B0AX36_9MUSC
MDNIEMLKALYDFQAVYPKTISFDEGEYFILYQTSARQRNWWQVVSMKGNIGFVPSNYVMKIKQKKRLSVLVVNKFLINALLGIVCMLSASASASASPSPSPSPLSSSST